METGIKKYVLNSEQDNFFGKSLCLSKIQSLHRQHGSYLAPWFRDTLYSDHQKPKVFQVLQTYLQSNLSRCQARILVHLLHIYLTSHSFSACSERPVPKKKNQIQETQLEQVSTLAAQLMLEKS